MSNIGNTVAKHHFRQAVMGGWVCYLHHLCYLFDSFRNHGERIANGCNRNQQQQSQMAPEPTKVDLEKELVGGP
jgi:hypothetical protein